MVLTSEITPLEPLPELPETDIIEGVRIVDGTTEDTDHIASALQRFEDAGWPLDNLEVRVGGEDGCGGHAGVRSTENGHDVVDICTDAEFVLLHELGHVWSALYLDDERRQEWLELRGLDTWHTPIFIAPNDRNSLINGFTWLFGVEPLHMSTPSVRV